MNCEDLAGEYDAWALGICEEPELSALREHLGSDCPVCVPGVRNALAFTAGLSGSVKLVDPPARLRARITGMLGSGADSAFGRSRWWPALALVFGLLALFAISATFVRSRSDRALSVLRSNDVRQLAIQQREPQIEVFASPTQGVLFLATNFKPAPAGKTYELWLIAKNAQPVPAGLFTPREDGSVLHTAKPLSQPLAAVAVTVEPESGSPQPTTKPFIIATP